MKYWKFFLTVIFVFFFCKSVQAKEPAVVFYNEIFWSGSFVSSADEFIELKNNTSENIDLAGWQITRVNSQGKEELMLEIPSGVIPAGGYFLIANSACDYQYAGGESILNIKPDLVDSRVSLSNDYLMLKIYDGVWDDGRNPLDIAGDGGKPLAGSNILKSSMQRIDPPLDGTKKENWIDTSTQTNLDFGRQELATPESSGKPEILNTAINPEKIFLTGDKINIMFTVSVFDPNGIEDIKSVILDLAKIGLGNSVEMFDDGTNGDIVAYDGVYSFATEIEYLPAGEKKIIIYAKDKKNLIAESQISLNFYNLSDSIMFNEVLPNPENGSESEFIELYNMGDKDINLFGWQLDDIAAGGSKPYLIKDNMVIKAKGYLVFYKKDTSIALNDNGDAIRLINPLGIEKSILSYPKTIKGYSYNRIDNQWIWSSTITPGAENIITDKNQGIMLFAILTISDAKKMPTNTQVTVVGIVNSVPGCFSHYYFYIQDDESGIQVYSSKKIFPEIKIGDKIKVSGKISCSSVGCRIKTTGLSDFELLEKGLIILPRLTKTGQLSKSLEGMFVKTKGYIVSTSGDVFYIDDSSGMIKIYVSDLTGISMPRKKKGDYVEINGIATIYRGENRLQPRFNADLKFFFLTKNIEDNFVKKAFASDTSGKKYIPLINPKAKEITLSGFLYQNLMKISQIIIIISIVLLGIVLKVNNVKDK